MRTEGFTNPNNILFRDIKVGQAVLWRSCVFIKAEPYDSANKANCVCVRNDKAHHLVPYLAYIGVNETVEVVKGSVHFD